MNDLNDLPNFNKAINDMNRIAKMQSLEARSKNYAQATIDYLVEVDQNDVWNKDAINSVRVFLTTAYKTGFKEALEWQQ